MVLSQKKGGICSSAILNKYPLGDMMVEQKLGFLINLGSEISSSILCCHAGIRSAKLRRYPGKPA